MPIHLTHNNNIFISRIINFIVFLYKQADLIYQMMVDPDYSETFHNKWINFSRFDIIDG